MDSKRLLVLVNAYVRAAQSNTAGRAYKASTGREPIPSLYERAEKCHDLWGRICSALGESPDCLDGLSDDELDPDHPFNDDGRE